MLADLGESASKKWTERIPSGRLYPSWTPPPYGWTKINVDAATSKNSALASIAAVARDDSGNFRGRR
jgi:lysozyme family protein